MGSANGACPADVWRVNGGGALLVMDVCHEDGTANAQAMNLNGSAGEVTINGANLQACQVPTVCAETNPMIAVNDWTGNVVVGAGFATKAG
jgi:hypothetical protein